jgi:pimeloyl-ACP methyl ester carboxylesterase
MPAALFVHGAGGGGWEWNVWARLFAADGFAVHAPDLQPGVGGLTATRLADYSRQVVVQLESLGQDRARKIVVVGASLGGLLALMNAGRAHALVLVNPIPPSPLHLRLPERDDYPEVISWGANASLESTRRSLPDADDAACLYAFRRWRDESGAVMNAARDGVVVVKPDCPLLVIASEHDTDIPSAISAELSRAFGSDILVAPNSSHVGPLLGRNATHIAKHAIAWLNDSAPKS